jgi:hypothetical protein
MLLITSGQLSFVWYDSTPVNKEGSRRLIYFSSVHVFGVGLVEVM